MTSRSNALFQLAFVAIMISAATPVAAAVSDWVDGTKSKVRLIAAGVGQDGVLNGVIEIALPPGWKTYWRNPGTAGIAPEIDFSASANLGTPQVAFPVPHKLDDGYSVTNVYEGSVMLPFRAMVPDLHNPVDVTLKMQFGVCEEVCIPDEVVAAVTVLPGESDPEAVRAIVAAREKIPGPPEPGRFAVNSVARNGGTDGRPVFRIDATMPAGAEPEAFVEGPADWSPYAPVLVDREGNHVRYDLKFSRLGSKMPISGAEISVTLAVGDKAIEQTITLD